MAGQSSRKRPKVGYLGPRGTFSMVAAEMAFPAGRFCPYSTIPKIFSAVRTGQVQVGVVPVYNSIQGVVLDTERELINRPKGRLPVFINGELVLDIVQCLMVQPEMSLEDIEVVFSHPQSLGQCRRYLRKNLSWARVEEADSNAEAVRVAMKTEGGGAIGPEICADIYGAKVVKRNIADSRDNRTRFWLIGLSDETAMTGDDLTTIAFSIPDRPGTLVRALMEVSSKDLNLIRVESRPHGPLGRYYFVVEFEGHQGSGKVKAALGAIEQLARFDSDPRRNGATLVDEGLFFKVLGSYPRWKGK